ncbi:MAG TPA: pyridoxal phosphate-dependent aminotransferase [Puia sp.]|jgi:aspartate/methionine/tyrosine aminotransferase|nr:pyridoxal phosphate-dependent aminotransferase [Puia sp.]
MFDPTHVDLPNLRKRAHNLRWATVPPGVIPLTAADPDFPCPAPVTEAIRKFLTERYFSYGPPEGIPEFKEAMARFFQEKRHIPATPASVLPVDSAAFGIYITCKAFLRPGDEAILFDPVDFLFRYAIEEVRAKPITLPIPQGSPAAFDRLEQLLTPKTRLICLCNPLNPTGKVFTKDELLQLGRLACRHDLVILSDEIWSDIVYKPHTFTSIASLDKEIADHTVTVTGFSKSYGLAGLRIGAVMTTNADHYARLFQASRHQSTVHGANLLSQVAATAALEECSQWLDEFVSHLHHMRDRCIDGLNRIPGFDCSTPEGCYVAFANITGTGRTSAGIRDVLFDQAKVAVVPGLPEWFGPGAAGYIRISFATSAAILDEALDRITLTIRNL